MLGRDRKKLRVPRTHRLQDIALDGQLTECALDGDFPNRNGANDQNRVVGQEPKMRLRKPFRFVECPEKDVSIEENAVSTHSRYSLNSSKGSSKSSAIQI